MADPYLALSKREQTEADALAARTADHHAGVITRTLASAAALAVRAAATEDPVEALQSIRTDPALLSARQIDEAKAERRAVAAISAAIVAGYAFDVPKRLAVVKAQSDGLAVAVGSDPDLTDFPVSGFTAAELGARLRQRLAQSVDEVLALPLSGLIAPSAIPGALGVVAQSHAMRVGNAVREAYHAGARAGSIEVGKALDGGSGDTGDDDAAPPDAEAPPGREPMDGDRVWYQYHTQHDNRVRPSHAALDGTVWRVDDPKAPTPPIDWGCRCYRSYCAAPGHVALPPPQAPRADSAVAQVVGDNPRPVRRRIVYAAYLDQHADGDWRALMRAAAPKTPAKQLAFLVDRLQVTGLTAADAREYGMMILAALRE